MVAPALMQIRRVFLALGVLVWVATAARAQVLLFPNGGSLPGEGVEAMGGAGTALAARGAAAWLNPAGLAKERGRSLALGVTPLLWNRHTGDTAEGAALRATFDHGALTGGPWGGRGSARFGWAIFLAQPIDHALSMRLAGSRLAHGADLPADLLGPDDPDTLFPEGFQREQTGIGTGTLHEITSGVGMGFALAPWFRMGVTLMFSRVAMRQQAETVVTFSGDSNPDADNTLAAATHTTARYEGTVDRTVLGAGVQLDLGRAVLLGASVRLPSQTVAGRGRARVVRLRSLQETVNGAPVADHGDAALVDAPGVAFDLRTPRETRLGVAFVGDRMILAVDLVHRDDLAPYQVFPALESGAGSPAPLRLEALGTSLDVVTSVAAGLAFTVSEAGTVLFGAASDDSGVPGNDPVFRRVNFQSLSLGYNHARDGTAYALGFTYRFSDGSQVRFPALGGGEPLSERVELESFALRAGAAWDF